MKTKPGFMLRSMSDSHVVVAVGQASLQFNGLITLNDAGALLWKQLEQGADYADLLNTMLSTYEIDEATAKRDIDTFIAQIKGAGLLEQ